MPIGKMEILNTKNFPKDFLFYLNNFMQLGQAKYKHKNINNKIK